MSMNITVSKELDSLVIVKLTGNFDVIDVPRFTQITKDNLTGAHSMLVLDFKDLSFIDSSAISCLIKLKNSIKKDGIELVIVDIQDDMLNLFRLAYLEKFFTIIDRRELLRLMDDQ